MKGTLEQLEALSETEMGTIEPPPPPLNHGPLNYGIAHLPGVIYRCFLDSQGGLQFPWLGGACQELLELAPWMIRQNPGLLLNLLAPDDLEAFQKALHDSAQTLKPWQWQGDLHLPSGQVRRVQCHGHPIQADHQPLYWEGLLVEIMPPPPNTLPLTRRQQAEMELQRQSWYAQLLANMTLKIRKSLHLEEILQTTVQEVQQLLQVDRVLIYRLPLQGAGVVVNEAVSAQKYTILGQKIEDPCFQSSYFALYRQGRVRAINDIEQADMQPCHSNFLKQFQIRANLIVPILQGDQLWGLLLAHHCQAPRQWTLLETDLLQQLANQVSIALAQAQLLETLRDREAEILKALEKERELNELKSQFVSMVSHEFRTPLATIAAASNLLKHFSYKLTEAEKQERLNKIQREVAAMTDLLEDILFIGQAGAGKTKFTPAPLDLVSFCHSITVEWGLMIGQSHTLDFQILGEPSPTEMDEKLLRQMLTNLLSNAIKYSPVGSKICFCLGFEADQVILQVQDQGIGIPDRDFQHLFEAFYRASNVANISGTGLGLYIISHAVKLHGGTIKVESREQNGTLFTIHLPKHPSLHPSLPSTIVKEDTHEDHSHH